MSTRFHKMHGAGNDFVVLDLRRQAVALDADRVRSLADRQTGIGFDQLLTLHEPRDAGPVARFEVWNADGSRAEQCGNGVRCLALLLDRQGEVGNETFTLEGVTGPVRLRCLGSGQVRADMGPPDFRAERVPTTLDLGGGEALIMLNGEEYRVGAVSMGNPHAVMVVSDVESAPVAILGKALSTHSAFPAGCNAGFVELLTPAHVRLRVFERGARETQACGSGACAAVTVLHRMGRLENRVIVDQAGGRLIIEWDGGAGSVLLIGPAVHVFEGTLP